MTDEEFDAMQADYDLCGVDGRLRDFAEAVQAVCERAYLDAVASAVAAERERIARHFDERDTGAGGFYDPHEPAEIIRALGPNV